MPPNAQMFQSNTETISPSKTNGGNVDFARRRRAQSNDMKFPPASDGRCGNNNSNSSNSNTILPLNINPPRSPTMLSRRRKTKTTPMRFVRTVCVYTFDMLVLWYVFRSIHIFMQSTSVPTSMEETKHDHPALVEESAVHGALALETVAQSTPSSFETSLPNMPICDLLEPDEVTYTLALQLSDNRLWMLQHHCELWGTAAPISVALWTTIGEDEILEKLKRMGCDTEYIHLQTLSSEGHLGSEYPVNRLRNMALAGATTTHALMLDVDFWESADLFDTLNLSPVRAVLAKDPKLAMVVPAFETQDLNCGTSAKCRARNMYGIPRDFEDLVIGLGSNKALPYDPTNFSRQGSTNYRRWMKQLYGEVVDIPCVSSDQYQPYMVVRLCDDLPPFQESFTGHGRNNMAWTLHLRRLGYRLQQVGRSFVTHYPHPSSQARLEWERTSTSEMENGATIDLRTNLRGRMDHTFWEFKKWLEANVADASQVAKCEDFGDDEHPFVG